VIVNTISKNANEQMQAALQTMDGNQALVSQLSAGPHPPGTTICGIKSWVVDLKTSMHIDDIGTFNPSVTGDIAPGLFLTKTGQATPATSIKAGDNMKVSLFNFPKGSTVNIQLVGGTTDAASKISNSLFTVSQPRGGQSRSVVNNNVVVSSTGDRIF